MSPFHVSAQIPALLVGCLFFLSTAPEALRSQDIQSSRVTLDYYRALAEGGIADAQLALGDIYREGKSVPANLIEAYAWYYLAALQGVEEAVQPMNEVFLALPESSWNHAKLLAELYEQKFLPRAKAAEHSFSPKLK